MVGVGDLLLWNGAPLVPAADKSKHNEAGNIAPVVGVYLVDSSRLQKFNHDELVVVVASVAGHTTHKTVRSQHTGREDHHLVKDLEGKHGAHEHAGAVCGPEDPDVFKRVQEGLV